MLVGPTPIEHGDATAVGDITVVNEKLAFAHAVQSAAPYGVPRGALIDLAPVIAGKIGQDRVVFADSIPNHWSAWPNTYQRVDIVERVPSAPSFAPPLAACLTWGPSAVAAGRRSRVARLLVT